MKSSLSRRIDVRPGRAGAQRRRRAAATPAGAMYPVPEARLEKPAVNMELVLRAAQLDPHRAEQPGDAARQAPASRRVQRQLFRKHFLSSRGPTSTARSAT